MQKPSLTNIIMTDDTSSVTISGDFSFVTAAWLDTLATCLESENLLKMEDGEVSDTMVLTAVAPSAVMTAQYLCISVPTDDDGGCDSCNGFLHGDYRVRCRNTNGGVAAKRW